MNNVYWNDLPPLSDINTEMRVKQMIMYFIMMMILPILKRVFYIL